jgi:hypothetical protein
VSKAKAELGSEGNDSDNGDDGGDGDDSDDGDGYHDVDEKNSDSDDDWMYMSKSKVDLRQM